MEVDVRVVQAEAVPAVLEHAEHQPLPTLGMECAVEEGAAFERLAAGRGVRHVLEEDRQRVVARGGLGGAVDGVGGFGLRRLEGDGGAIGPGRGIVGMNVGFGFSQEVRGRQLDTPARGGLVARGPGPG